MKFVVANWKQNMTLEQIQGWISSFDGLVASFPSKATVILCPPLPYLSLFVELTEKYEWLCLGSQDVAETELGAHTGNIDSTQVADFAEYSIIGHSERKEPRDLVEKKVQRCLAGGLKPVVCFVEKEDGKDSYKEGVIVAWEDPQNISQNGVYSPKDPAEVEKGLNEVAELLPEGARILYGGSVNRDNISELVEFKNFGGVILGGASLDPQHLFDIITAFK